MEDYRATRTYGHGSTRNTRYGRRVQNDKSSPSGQTRVMDKVDNPWTVTVMGRHLAVWATEAKVPPEICLWRPTFTSKSLPMEPNSQPKLQTLWKNGTLDHILSSCKVTFSQGRYRWRHDTCLRKLAHILELERKKKHPKGNTGITFIPFVKEGTTNMPTSNAKKQGILLQASDWTKSCNFQTSSRRLSDQTMSSSQLLQSALSLWNCQYLERKGARAHMNWKKAKYTDLQTLCKERGWQP